jgi:hypothetical protein
MPGAYAIDEPRRLVLSRGWGRLTDDELLVHARTLRADPRFSPDFAQLCDLLGVTSVEATATEIKELGELNPFGKGARRALIISSGAAYGFGRMYETIRKEGDELKIFPDLDTGLAWLGLTGARTELLDALARAPEVKIEA